VNLVPFAQPGKGVSAVAVVLGVRQAATRDVSRATGPVKVLAAAFDRNGRSVQSENQTVGITLPANAAGDFSYEVLSRLELKPGRYEVRVAFDASAGQRASVYGYVDVPDFAQHPLSLSGVAFTVSPAHRSRVGVSSCLSKVEGPASGGWRQGPNSGRRRPHRDGRSAVIES
jgi:hypothetical protein